MAAAKDDDSTDIESLVKQFAKDMDKACADLRKARIDKAKKESEKKKVEKPADPPVVTFALEQNPKTKSRTPAEQAAEVSAGRSMVCWGAHMADKARHVVMKANGSITWDYKKTMGGDFEEFKKCWAAAMKRNGLRNAKGGDGWFEGDAFHLEMPDSKISKTDVRVAACLDEYARLTREDGEKKNDRFETTYAKELNKYLAPYEMQDEKP